MRFELYQVRGVDGWLDVSGGNHHIEMPIEE